MWEQRELCDDGRHCADVHRVSLLIALSSAESRGGCRHCKRNAVLSCLTTAMCFSTAQPPGEDCVISFEGTGGLQLAARAGRERNHLCYDQKGGRNTGRLREKYLRWDHS